MDTYDSIFGRYECHDKKEGWSIYWEIEDKGDFVELKYGRIGFSGGRREEITHDEALEEVDKKLARGFVQVSSHMPNKQLQIEAKKRVEGKRKEREEAKTFMELLRKA